MPDLITINDVQIEQLAYHDEPVVTCEMIARVHGVSIQNVHKSFSRHQRRFIEGKHYYRIHSADAEGSVLGVQTGQYGAILFTQKGYLLLVKPMKDEKSWQVQERMIDEYFAMKKALQNSSRPVPSFYNPQTKAMIEQIIRLDAIEAEQAATKDALLATQTEQLRQQQEIIAAQARALEAKETAVRAESTAHIILDRYRMTLEQFVGAQKDLLSVIPPATFRVASRWLTDYCRQQNWDTPALPVQGRPWPTEKAYPVEALMRYVEYLKKRPQQIALVPKGKKGGTV